MGKLEQISVNGVDNYTNLDELAQLQEEYPLVEFGILLSANWIENGVRYLNPDKLKDFESYHLNLSAHLCGRVARDARQGNMDSILELCQGHFGLFNRMQLNIAPYNYESLIVKKIENISEIIIQQKSDMNLFMNYQKGNKRDDVVVLVDNSGGNGIEQPITIYNGIGKVGYAGGLNPDNIREKTKEIFMHEDKFWIDMESGVRSEIDGISKFDTEKVRRVLDTIYSLM